jgi:hypothetical protein
MHGFLGWLERLWCARTCRHLYVCAMRSWRCARIIGEYGPRIFLVLGCQGRLWDRHYDISSLVSAFSSQTVWPVSSFATVSICVCEGLWPYVSTYVAQKFQVRKKKWSLTLLYVLISHKIISYTSPFSITSPVVRKRISVDLHYWLASRCLLTLKAFFQNGGCTNFECNYARGRPGGWSVMLCIATSREDNCLRYRRTPCLQRDGIAALCGWVRLEHRWRHSDHPVRIWYSEAKIKVFSFILSFHLDHAAALTYIMEKVNLFAVPPDFHL